MDDIQQKSILQNLEVFAENIDLEDDDESLGSKLRDIVCLDSKDGQCDLADMIIHQLMDFDGNGDGRLSWMQLSKFVDSVIMIQNLDTTDVETSLSDIFTKIKEEEAWTEYDYKSLQILSDERKAANFVKYSKDYVLFAFQEIRQQILVHKDMKERIEISFFPETQTIPKKYFPMNGDEETPYVAIKLHLQDRPG